MATIHEFGSAPEQVKDGYKIVDEVYGRVSDLAEEYDDETRLVIGPEITERPGEHVVAVMERDPELIKKTAPKSSGPSF